MESSPPPPAYSLEEFDQKISAAQEVSLTTAQPPPRIGEEEEWETWDESAFEAAAQAMAAASSNKAQLIASCSSQVVGSSSRLLPTLPKGDDHDRHDYVEPLRIHKRAESRSSPGASSSSKQAPSWYAEAGLADSLSSSSSQGAGPTLSSRAGHPNDVPWPSTPQPVHHIPTNDAEDAEDRSLPPPPFVAVGPSLDGPQYEDVVTLAYHGNGSSPPSPLTSPVPVNSLLPIPSPPDQPVYSHTQPLVQHLPQEPVLSPLSPPSINTHRMEPRPMASTSLNRPAQTPEIPHMDFNPSVAYPKRGGHTDLHRAQEPSHSIDATAFYKSAFIFVSSDQLLSFE
jgi:hypothetical protein